MKTLKHINNTADIYSCSKCNSWVNSVELMEIHERNHENFKCKECNWYSPSSLLLAVHRAKDHCEHLNVRYYIAHADLGPYINGECRDCKKVFDPEFLESTKHNSLLGTFYLSMKNLKE